MIVHHYQHLIKIFNRCFKSYNTKLALGTHEPLYLPANQQRGCATIFFANGFFSSALHECAHWLIAGVDRRKLVDFGYWYAPDGRTNAQQELFQQVEVKPQALEWILAVACGYRFSLSCDNLDGAPVDAQAFSRAIYSQVLQYIEFGLPLRAQILRVALCNAYKISNCLHAKDFDMHSI